MGILQGRKSLPAGPVRHGDLADGNITLGPRFADLSMIQGGWILCITTMRIVLKSHH